jgi:hypothetical protein
MLRKTEIRVIYDQGIEAVATTIKQLYEMIEVEDERVHNLVAPTSATHLQKIEVTEHHSQTKVCGRCGMKNKAGFPSGVNAPVQYGQRVRAVVAYLMSYQLIPYERCAETMNDLFNCQLSTGTLATIFKECSGELTEPLLLIKEGLRKTECWEWMKRICESIRSSSGFTSHPQIN